ncbi:hypothetical protein E8E12_000798 [Didymella heteroderae]|uniref:Uncharacterized protein n=1 Tax=Didymella heteroderae TaxID=1769908 RepID=A0A9P4WFN9_9PLEO|nr:hypothetical protein E8E12_000798 [Didymella heteroderae]
MRLPDQREVKPQRAVELTELLINHSVQGLNTLALLIRRWLRSLKMQEVQRPMGPLQNRDTQARYIQYIFRFVYYLMRFEADRIARLPSNGYDSSTTPHDDDTD